MRPMTRPGLVAALLLGAVVSANAQEDQAVERYRRAIAALGEQLEPSDRTQRRWVHSNEVALAALPYDEAQVVALESIGDLCRQEEVDLVVLGELHGRTLEHATLLMRALANALPERPRVLAHEFVCVEWQPWLDRMNADGELADARELVRLAHDASRAELERAHALHPNGPLSLDDLRRHVDEAVDKNYGCVAAMCAQGRAAGFELQGLASTAMISTNMRLVVGDDVATAQLADWQGSRDRAFHERLAQLAARADRPLVLAVMGERHALGEGRVADLWRGHPPVVVLVSSTLARLELRRRELWPSLVLDDVEVTGPDAVFRLGPRTFFLKAGEDYHWRLPPELAAAELRER